MSNIEHLSRENRKLVSRWIPHLLTEEQKAARVDWCQKTLDRFNSENTKNVYSIVSGDESWIYCYETENKRQSAVWVFQGEEKPTKVIHSRSSPPSFERRIILHQDNASSHTAQKTRQMQEENVELLDHPPYSPDLSPNEFFTFPKIKNRLLGQRFQSPEEAVDAFKNAVLDLPANEWNKCFENWFERMQMCINLLSAGKKLGYLFRPKKYFSSHDLLTLCKAQIRNSLEYCSHVWGAAASTTLSILDAVQRRAVRLIDDSSLTDSLGTLSHRRAVGDLDLFYRYTNGLCSSQLSRMMPPRNMPARQTRLTLASHPNRVELRKSTTGRYDRSFVPRVLRVWNNLQEEAFPSSTNLRQFENRY
ncbi:unnamed protein product [Acanthoscelides obtectus]|uniref:Tc1-like transposase DDE domain-containing protein n=1 Tax=Acanthoscelides obtectus TaxID=200917 RepID=A0A9P0JJD7_ACAOB|nr:unnamed protein product [Acanthoscelides obtectus]CAK1654374.1 Histone-lysine N-methyltransferase SETMAR [Acanthoscelides obtectus]